MCVLSYQDRDVRLSKSMSYALRHGANQMGLHMGTGESPALEKLTEREAHHVTQL